MFQCVDLRVKKNCIRFFWFLWFRFAFNLHFSKLYEVLQCAVSDVLHKCKLIFRYINSQPAAAAAAAALHIEIVAQNSYIGRMSRMHCPEKPFFRGHNFWKWQAALCAHQCKYIYSEQFKMHSKKKKMETFFNMKLVNLFSNYGGILFLKLFADIVLFKMRTSLF